MIFLPHLMWAENNNHSAKMRCNWRNDSVFLKNLRCTKVWRKHDLSANGFHNSPQLVTVNFKTLKNKNAEKSRLW